MPKLDEPSLREVRPDLKKRKTLRSVVLAWFLVMLGTVTFVPGSPQESIVRRWNPRRVPAGTEFVGDQTCAECHTSRVAIQLKSSMAIAMESVADSKVLSAKRSMSFKLGGYSYEIKREGKGSIYKVTDGKDTISLPISYAFGQGKAGQTYVLEYDGGLYESLVSFYKEIDGLDFTIGANRNVPATLKDALGRRLSENEINKCFGCHATGAVMGGKFIPEKVIPGVRCESCHGPGARHVAASKAGEPSAGYIFNPRRLSGDELSQEFCAACHRGNSEYAELQSMGLNNVRFQPYRLFHSKCYSDDRRIGCTGCHNPHESIKQDVAYYDAKCAACHSAKPAEPGSESGRSTTGVVCSVGTKDCASCHMPRTSLPGGHFKFTDHYIRIVRPGSAYPN